MANYVSKLTKITSAESAGTEAGYNPTDYDINKYIQDPRYFNEGNFTTGEYDDGAEFHGNFDTAEAIIIDGLEKFLHNPTHIIQFTTNATAEAFAGSAQTALAPQMQGSMDGVNYVTLSQGGMGIIPVVSTGTAKNKTYILDEIEEGFMQLKSAGKWPYLRMKIQYGNGATNNSDIKFKFRIRSFK